MVVDDDSLFPGDGRSIDDIARRYVAEARQLVATGDPDPDAWASFHISNLLIHDRRNEAWDVLVRAVELTDDDDVLGLLGAGYLEDLVEYHGDEFIDRIEAQAGRSGRFRRALGAIWAFDSPVRGRVDAILGINDSEQ